jgi:hypothetical protein
MLKEKRRFMTRKVRTTKITIEQHKITIIRKRNKRISIYCERCRTQVQAYTPEEAVTILQIQMGEINHLVSSGEIHFIETTEGSLPLVCGG